MNLYSDLPVRVDKKQNTFHAVVEISKGSSNKIEYQSDGGYFMLDRALYQSFFYPFDYGFIPQTIAGDNDPLDVMLLVTQPTFPGCVIKARAIWCIDIVDTKWHDVKILAVPIHEVDPRRDEVQSYKDLPAHIQQELLLFFKEYRKLETAKYDKIKIGGFMSVKTALDYIKDAKENYEKRH